MTIAAAGLLISGYALGVVIGAPVLTVVTARLPRKTVLIALMAIFVAGNTACARGARPDDARPRFADRSRRARFFSIGCVEP